MVAEYRELIFSTEELKDAIYIFHKDKSTPFPVGGIEDITVKDSAGITAHVHLKDSSTVVAIDGNHLAAMMLYYCIKTKIPVPKQGHKEIIKTENGLALSISINGKASNKPAKSEFEKKRA